MNTEITPTYSPTVLLIDDDPSISKYIRNRFHSETSIGVVTANRLDEAREIALDKKIHLDAVLADIVFEGGTDDPEHQIYDGIDFLSFLKDKRPKVSQYVVSCWADVSTYHQRSKKLKLHVEEWFQKLSFGVKPSLKSPWIKVERDLYKKALSKDRTLNQRLNELEIKFDNEIEPEIISEHIRHSLKLPIKTYIQDIGVEYLVKQPIEVICMIDEQNIVAANALRLGLLQQGGGKNVEEAIDDLINIIRDQLVVFKQEKTDNIIGYAALVKDNLDTFIERI